MFNRCAKEDFQVNFWHTPNRFLTGSPLAGSVPVADALNALLTLPSVQDLVPRTGAATVMGFVGINIDGSRVTCDGVFLGSHVDLGKFYGTPDLPMHDNVEGQPVFGLRADWGLSSEESS